MKQPQEKNNTERNPSYLQNNPARRVDSGQKAITLWHQLGRYLHTISYLRILFFILALYFQFKTMFLSTGDIFIENVSKTLLMYGIAMSFESLRDTSTISMKKRGEYHTHRTLFRWTILFVFAGGIFSIVVGCFQFFFTDFHELGWAITVFGLGMLSLGRQQYDQLSSALASAYASDSSDVSRPQISISDESHM